MTPTIVFQVERGQFSAILPSGGRILVSLNVKNQRAHELAAELADLTGESLTTTVILALEERLEKERKKKRGSGAKAEKMLRFAERFAAGKPKGLTSGDHGAVLYGADGMPR
jgi:antitoxin VapB